MPRKKRDGSPMFAPQRPALIGDRVRYVGDPVAMVVAETLAEAKDAAELVVVDYETLPSVTDVADAAKPGAPVVWDENGDNISHTFERGDKAATDAAFAKAKHIVRRRHVISRVHAQFMEPRGSLGVFDKFEDRYTLYADVNYRTGCATCWRRTCSRCRKARSASSSTMSAAGLAPRAGSMSITGWCWWRRRNSTGR